MSQHAFSATGELAAVGASYKTILDIVAATTVRPAIHFFKTSCGGTPADNVITQAVMRHTTANTGTSVTPTPLDSATVAAVATALENCSAEGTYTAGSELDEFDIYQRATYQWVAKDGCELVCPATASNGIGIRSKAAVYTGVNKAIAHFRE